MRVGIAGAGNIGMGYAAILSERGHEPYVWSPSGERTKAISAGEPLVITGALDGSYAPQVCASAQALAGSDVIVLALPAYAHRFVLDSLLPHLEERHTIIISGHLSFAALYLAKRLAERGIEIPIVAWSTTVLTCKPRGPNRYNIGAIRAKVDAATLPARYADRAMELCAVLFGDRFSPKDDILTIALSNINPQDHLGMALCNLSRIERGENWGQNTMVTPAIGKFLEALDRERVAIAATFGKEVRTIFDHYQFSHGISGSSVSEMNAILVERGSDPLGPTDLDTRYILEDVPFGIVPTLYLAQLGGIPAPLHQSGLQIISACYGRDFAADNDLLSEIGPLEPGTMSSLMTEGYSAAADAAQSSTAD